MSFLSFYFFFFNDTATTEIYTLSLHDALPISEGDVHGSGTARRAFLPFAADLAGRQRRGGRDRKSTRLNSSHSQISYAVFCLKKKKKKIKNNLLLHLHNTERHYYVSTTINLAS